MANFITSTTAASAAALLWICIVLEHSGLAEASIENSDDDSCQHETLLSAAVYFAATLETFSRGFALGFGIRMMKFTWIDGKDVSWRERVQVSSESGVAVAAIVHGSALFLPHSVRQRWFDY